MSAGNAKPIASLAIFNPNNAVLPDCTLWIWVPAGLNLVPVFAKLFNTSTKAAAASI
jgi:hypothetical protein